MVLTFATFGEATSARAGASADVIRVQVRRVLEEQLANIDSPAAAEAVLDRTERLASDDSEADRVEETVQKPTPAAVNVAAAAPALPSMAEERAAAASGLVAAAAEAVAPTPDAPAVQDAVHEALGTDSSSGALPVAPPSPAAQRGRTLLRRALLRRLRPLEAVDARVFLVINGVPHPNWLDGAAHAIAILTRSGWLWLAGVLCAYLLRVPRGRQALVQAVPSVLVATAIVEYPLKHFARRRRPFIDIVRALVIGKKPKSWSFPSGHTAASFASAQVLSSIWPAARGPFFGVASCVGLSRIYVGDHYPGDVLSGAIFGLSLAESIRRGVVYLSKK